MNQLYIYIYMYIFTLFQIPFPYRPLYGIDQSSLCYTVGPYQLSILQLVGSQFPGQGSNPCPLQQKHRVLTTGLPGNSRSGHSLNECVSSVYSHPNTVLGAGQNRQVLVLIEPSLLLGQASKKQNKGPNINMVIFESDQITRAVKQNKVIGSNCECKGRAWGLSRTFGFIMWMYLSLHYREIELIGTNDFFFFLMESLFYINPFTKSTGEFKAENHFVLQMILFVL